MFFRLAIAVSALAQGTRSIRPHTALKEEESMWKKITNKLTGGSGQSGSSGSSGSQQQSSEESSYVVGGGGSGSAGSSQQQSSVGSSYGGGGASGSSQQPSSSGASSSYVGGGALGGTQSKDASGSQTTGRAPAQYHPQISQDSTSSEESIYDTDETDSSIDSSMYDDLEVQPHTPYWRHQKNRDAAKKEKERKQAKRDAQNLNTHTFALPHETQSSGRMNYPGSTGASGYTQSGAGN